jgi:hypothetical protein
MQPAFGGFMNDPTAQMGFQIGKSAVDAGQQYAEQTVSIADVFCCRRKIADTAMTSLTAT